MIDIDTRPTDELLRIALRTKNREEYISALGSLIKRGTNEVFDLAHQMCIGNTIDERVLGADILGHIGTPGRFRSEEAVDILISLLQDRSIDVVRSAVVSLGFQKSPKSLNALIGLKCHHNPIVRQSVAFALSRENYDDNDISICARIELSSDSDRNVREEATTSLSYLDPNRIDVGQALRRRIYDEDGEIRADALLGLATRDEQDIVDMLLLELSRSVNEGEVWDQALDAALELSDPRILPVLLQLKEIGVESAWLDDAIEACSGSKAN